MDNGGLSEMGYIICFTAGALTAWIWFYLFSEREYRVKNEILEVKHGKFGKWYALKKHYKSD